MRIEITDETYNGKDIHWNDKTTEEPQTARVYTQRAFFHQEEQPYPEGFWTQLDTKKDAKGIEVPIVLKKGMYLMKPECFYIDKYKKLVIAKTLKLQGINTPKG